ncbi:Ig-like domain-containing protein [Bacillus sp. REN3]|uniref:Ig-like domain-containing protein n=1 Tax=Bacillus sp. REN3 TaxID=2802440 RepID=UPI001AEED9BE|nr:Ig-like domain-containing protein [Bacillus sp. REN3]
MVLKSYFTYCLVFFLFAGSVMLPFPNQKAFSELTEGEAPADSEAATPPSDSPSTTAPEEPANELSPEEPPVTQEPSAGESVPEESTPEVPAEETTEPDTGSGTSTLTMTAASTARPFVTDIQIVSKDDAISYPGADMTQVPIDAKIRVTIRDDTDLADHPLPFILNDNDREKVDINVQRVIKENGDYLFTITPSAGSFSYSGTYYLYVDPALTDIDGNRVFPAFIKFTTQSNPHRDAFYRTDPHGFYMTNTNMCANCHSTHIENKPTIGDNKYPVKENTENYCMACHDGTMGIPMPDKLKNTNSHDEYTDGSSAPKEVQHALVSSCTNCHNPHLSWTAGNPNLLKDHFVYDHDQSANPAAAGVGIQDSETVLCENCHDAETPMKKRASTNKVFHYRKDLWTAASLQSDTPLCLKCHNAENESKNPKLVDIEKYYQDISSGHYIATTLPDGTEMQGQMPCSDCHETHGSMVLKQLRESLGNAPVADGDKFKVIGADWTAADERTFCLKCHNGQMDLYKKTPSLPETNALNEVIEGHTETSTAACSSCHSNEPESSGFLKQSISGAHAPKKLKPAQ